MSCTEHQFIKTFRTTLTIPMLLHSPDFSSLSKMPTTLPETCISTRNLQSSMLPSTMSQSSPCLSQPCSVTSVSENSAFDPGSLLPTTCRSSDFISHEASTNHDPQDETTSACMIPIPGNPNKTLKRDNRKSMQANWPRPSELSTTEIIRILDEHNVNVNPSVEFSSLERLYLRLIETLKFEKASKKAKRDPSIATSRFPGRYKQPRSRRLPKGIGRRQPSDQSFSTANLNFCPHAATTHATYDQPNPDSEMFVCHTSSPQHPPTHSISPAAYQPISDLRGLLIPETVPSTQHLESAPSVNHVPYSKKPRRRKQVITTLSDDEDSYEPLQSPSIHSSSRSCVDLVLQPQSPTGRNCSHEHDTDEEPWMQPIAHSLSEETLVPSVTVVDSIPQDVVEFAHEDEPGDHDSPAIEPPDDDEYQPSGSSNDDFSLSHIEEESVCYKPCQESQSPSTSRNHFRSEFNHPELTITRDNEDQPLDLPPSSRLTVALMKMHLDQYHIRYQSRDRKARIVELYDAIRTRQIAMAREKTRDKRRERNTHTSRRNHRSVNRPPVSQPQRHASPPLLLSEQFLPSTPRVQSPTMQSVVYEFIDLRQQSCDLSQLTPPLFSEPSLPFSPPQLSPTMQSVVYKRADLPAMPSTIDNHDKRIPQSSSHQCPYPPDMTDSTSPQAQDNCGGSQHVSIDNESSDIFRWRSSVPPACDNAPDGRCRPCSGSLLRELKSYASESRQSRAMVIDRLETLINRLEGSNAQGYAAPGHGLQSSGTDRDRRKAKTAGRTASGPQGGGFARLIRRHVATLIGSRTNSLPHHDEQDSVMGADHEGSSDPSFPYPGGPGHPSATPETLSIMWRMMSQAGIRSFRPDFTQPFDNPDNEHLLDLAVKTFVELVECDEYTGIDAEALDEETIRTAIFLHVTQRLRRRYREENSWSEGQRIDNETNSRRHSRLTNLRHGRIATLSHYPSLSGLVPIVKACCSDDDSDIEASQSIQRSYSQEQPKICTIRNIPWRHPRVTEMMDTIDALTFCESAANPKARAGAAPRIRRRVSSPVESQLKPPTQVPISCYKHEWLESQPQHRVNALRLRSKPDVNKLICQLERILSEM